MLDAKTKPQLRKAVGDGSSIGAGDGNENGPTENRTGPDDESSGLDELVEVLVDSLFSVLFDEAGSAAEIVPCHAHNGAKVRTGSRSDAEDGGGAES